VKRLCAGLAVFLLMPAAAVADGPAVANGPRAGCGGDAYSFAEIVPHGAGEPLVAVPDTLCADLANSGAPRIESLNIYVDRRAQEADQPPSGRQPESSRPRRGGIDKGPSWRPNAPFPIWRQ
jgi:hypothetical protein